MAIKDTLKERQKTHGSFEQHSLLSQKLKFVLQAESTWATLTPYQKEALDMICHKIARIMSGNKNHIDHWHDIAGYATLVEDIIKENV